MVHLKECPKDGPGCSAIKPLQINTAAVMMKAPTLVTILEASRRIRPHDKKIHPGIQEILFFPYQVSDGTWRNHAVYTYGPAHGADLNDITRWMDVEGVEYTVQSFKLPYEDPDTLPVRTARAKKAAAQHSPSQMPQMPYPSVNVEVQVIVGGVRVA